MLDKATTPQAGVPESAPTASHPLRPQTHHMKDDEKDKPNSHTENTADHECPSLTAEKKEISA